jgi:hypothetical protein
MKDSRKIIETSFVFFVFFLTLACYLHSLFSGYLSDIPGHIGYTVLFNNGLMESLPHPVFVLLLNQVAGLCELLGIDMLVQSLGLHTGDMVLYFKSQLLWVSQIAGIDRSSLAYIKLDMRELVNFHIAAALIMSFFIALNAYIIYRLFMYLLAGYSTNMSLCMLLAMAAIIVTPIYLPFFNVKLYLGQGSPNVWHNPTYILMKPFSYLAFFFIARLFMESDRVWSRLALVSVFFVLSAVAKPSFIIVFLPTVVIYSLLRGPWDIKMHARLFLTFLPVVGLLVYQYIVAYQSTNSQLIFDFLGVWRLWSPFIPVSIMLALAFPLSVLVIRPFSKGHDNAYLTLAWTGLMVSMFQLAVLAESGPRYMHSNFFWGYNISQDLLFIFSLLAYARWIIKSLGPDRGVAMKERIISAFGIMSRKEVFGFTVCSLALVLHLASGTYYMASVFMGKGY